MHNMLLDSTLRFARALGQKVYKLELVQALQVFFIQAELKPGEVCHGYI